MDIGIIANPASGKDIRRLTAQASVFDNQEKSAIVRRCLAGIRAMGPMTRIHYYPDSHHITQAALVDAGLEGIPLAMETTGTSDDTTLAAKKMPPLDALISLGGDGTNRAIAKGGLDVPLIALSTGTNNAFPTLCEATSAGMAAALIAAGEVSIDIIAPKTKAVHVEFENGDSDLALIDVVGTVDRFAGTRALLEPRHWTYAMLSVADPSKVGMTAVGGIALPVKDEDDFGLWLNFSSGKRAKPVCRVIAPVAPGIVAPVKLKKVQTVKLHRQIQLHGATMLAFDGERERTLDKDEPVSLWFERDGPRRVDIAACLRHAALNDGALHAVANRKMTHAN